MPAELSPYLVSLAPELIIAAGVMIILLWGILFPRKSAAALSLFSLGILTAALFVLIFLVLRRPDLTAGPLLMRGGLSPVFRVMIIFAAALTVFLSHDYLAPFDIQVTEYYLLVLLATLGMMFTAAAGHFLVFVLGIELTGLSFYILAAMIPGSARSKEASLKYLIYGLLASGILLYGLSMVYGLWGSWDIRHIAGQLSAGGGGAAASLALVFIMAGVGFKIGLAPFHMWVPDVYDGSPAPVAAFLSVGPKVATFAAAATIFLEAFPGLSSIWVPLLGGAAVLSMVWGNLAALAQRSLKRMIAYSSVAQVGYITLGLLAAARRPEDGIVSLGFYLFAYLFYNLGFFALIIWMEDRKGMGPSLDDVAGFGRRRPLAALAFTLFLLSLAGIPPTSGFMAKFWIFMAAVRAKMVVLAVIGVLTSVVAAFYYLRVVYYFFMKEPGEAREGAVVEMNIAFFAVALACLTTIWFGIWPNHLLNIVQLAILH